MSAIDNLILEHLRALRVDSGDLKRDLRDVKARLASIESYIATPLKGARVSSARPAGLPRTIHERTNS
jgi:hypothetical protein